MNTQDKIKEKFQKLLKEGEQILASSGWNGRQFHHFPNKVDYLRFRTEALNIIRRACGENSDHYHELQRLAEDQESDNDSSYFPHCFGVLQAGQRDYEGGLLFDLKTLVAAELLGDFLEQSELLVKEGYHVPAASLSGAVLEDTLRKLSQANQIPVHEKSKIDRLNADLAKAGVYNKLIQKRITALADIRNNADHGHFDKFAHEDVEDMVKWIRKFTADYL